MEPVLRALAIYVGLLVIFRISGKRTLAQITTFDFVLLLIVGEATQQGLLGDDFSVTNAFLVIITLICADVALSFLKEKLPGADKVAEGRPIVIFQDGRPIRHRMDRARVDESDVLSAAREKHGIERLEQIKFAVLEQSGSISIVPDRARS